MSFWDKYHRDTMAVMQSTHQERLMEMTKQEYAEYQQSVADFMTREGITNLTAISAEEPHFSWTSCDCCGSPLGGDREYASGYNPITKAICGPYSVCEDCIYYAEYGRLDDMTMMDIG